MVNGVGLAPGALSEAYTIALLLSTGKRPDADPDVLKLAQTLAEGVTVDLNPEVLGPYSWVLQE